MNTPKENDMLLNMLANPLFTVTDFQSVGLTGDNTNLLSEDTYKASDKIRNNEIFQTDGKFDEAKFHKFYVGAGQFYNQLTTQNYEQAIMDEALFSKDNIWVEPAKRKLDYTPKLTRRANENLVTSSLDSVGKRGPRTMSISEIAQTQKVYDTKTGEWKDSPNDAFFSNFFDTLVLATYDEDVFDPETGQKIHSKGEYKLNDAGTYYYETLGGRDVYGKQVLNKMNMLTTDGSAANKFDFFDSDDIEQKSIGGSILKNAALVGTMFIPGIGPVIRGLSVLNQAVGLAATLGKLFVGNENETLNNIQAWTKTVNRSSQTEYAAQNTWCTENFLNMIGDTVGQLKEQRWIFQTAPYLFGDIKGAKAMTTKGYEALKKAKVKELNDTFKVKDVLDDVLKQGGHNLEKKGVSDYVAGMNQLIKRKALNYADDLVKQAQKVSSPLAKAYMTGITVQDTYGEAKAAGASDMEAALLTLGYAAGEAAILNTGLGEWIMPELQGDKFKMRAIANALTKEVREANEKYIVDKAKKTWVQKILETGRKIANNHYAEQALLGTKGLDVVGAHALGEAFEETSEELLADLSKSIFNVTRWLRGEEALDLGEWENVGDRYLMSALGGFVGGGITSAGTDFQTANSLSKMNKTQAMQELIYMVNNGQEKEFLKQVNKMNLGNKNLSAKNIIDTINDKPIFAEGTKSDNQDAAIKNLVKNEVAFIKNVLESEGAKISTESLLNKLTLEDQNQVLREFKLINLQNTQSMGLFLQNFQNLQNDLVVTHAELAKLNVEGTDTSEDTPEIASRRKLLEEKLKLTQEEIQHYLNGNLVPEATRDAIFEMNPLLSDHLIKIALPFYAERMYGKKWNELSDSEKEEATKKHKAYMETSAKNDIHTAAGIFHDMTELFTPFATQAQQYVQNLQKEEYKSVLALQNTTQNILEYLKNVDTSEGFDSDVYIDAVQGMLDGLGQSAAEATIVPTLSEDLRQQLKDIINKPVDEIYTEQMKAREYTTLLQDAVIDMVDSQVKPFLKLGHINPEVKQALLASLETTKRFAIDQRDKAEREESTASTPAEAMLAGQRKLKYSNDALSIQEHQKEIRNLTNTPILEYLNQFALSTTNSDLNITKHWETTKAIFIDNKEDYGMFTVDQEWTDDNEEALNLVNSFIAVINGMKVDNASFNNPTGYTKILNNIYKGQGVKDYVELTELDSTTADLILQDALLIKDRLEFAKTLSDINSGQKLKQQDKVAANKNILLYKQFQHFVTSLDDDEWSAKKDWNGIDELRNTLESLSSLPDFADKEKIRLNKEERVESEKETILIEDAIYDFFEKNKEADGSINSDKLGGLLKQFAGMGGFFQKTGDLLTEGSKSLDTNSFIWYLAARAAVKSSNYQGAYKDSITDEIAPIASQGLATYLGVAAITNMNVLNSFVEAYRNTVVKEFNDLEESERTALLNDFDGSTLYSKDLLKYFAGHNVLPQYLNMVFIEGAPGTGKSKGVFTSVINMVNKIDPEFLKGAMYVHATEDSAKEANTATGLNGIYKSREDFLKYISSEWKDTKHNIKTEKDSAGEKRTGRFLYDDSYEFKDGRIVNKWKLNHYGDDVPKVIFIDEVTHYNQQELSMIEQFARENGIVVLTAGDMDQDTQVAYAKLEGRIADVTMHRNNFVRSPKLGVSLRTLNKQMTNSVTSTQAAIERLRHGKTAQLNFNYLDSDPNHRGLYGVKTHQVETDDMSDAQLEEIKQSIQLMVDTATGPIGYIYSDPNSKLYKYITSNFGEDKIKPFKDSDAQGLEGQYYIVENKRSFAGTAPSSDEQAAYIRSIYTGISRAEQGVLVIAPSSYGNIETIGSKEDKRYQFEEITPAQKKKAADAGRNLLEQLLEGLSPEPLTINRPTPVATTRTTPPVTPGTTLTPPVAPPVIPSRYNHGYQDLEEAKRAMNDFADNLRSIGHIADLLVEHEGTDKQITQIDIYTIDNGGITYHVPFIQLEDGTRIDLDDAHSLTIKNKNTSIVAPVYSVDDKITIEEGGVSSNVRIKSVNISGGNIEYEIENLDDGSTRTISQSELQSIYKGIYTPEPEPSTPETIPTTIEEIEGTVEEAIFEATLTPEPTYSPTFTPHVYTFNTMEMGVVRDSSNKPVFEGLSHHFDARIDNAVGLMHLSKFKTYTYDDLESEIAYLHGLVNTIEKNDDLADIIRTRLGLDGNVKIAFAVKSSAPHQDASRNWLDKNGIEVKYDRYDIDDVKEKLSYIQSDDKENAEKPMRKKMVMLVEEDGKTVFELTVASLNSPLTILQRKNSDGSDVYKEEANTFYSIYRKNKSDETLYPAIEAVINNHKGGPNQDLIELLKFWQFTSNGIFYMPEDFNLAANSTEGTELIEHKGENQLDGNLSFTKQFIDLKTFAIQDKRLYVSSVFASPTGMLGSEKKINPGHSFVLVSDNPDYSSDDALVKQYERQNEPGYTGKKEVKLYYIAPPKSSVGEYLQNQHNLYTNASHSTSADIYNIGNEFTPYRILQQLVKSGRFDELESSYGKNAGAEIKQYVEKLNSIEEKWSKPDLPSMSSEEKSRFDKMKATVGEKRARQNMAISEQAQLLQSIPTFSSVIGSSMSKSTNLSKHFANYVTNMVWFKTVAGSIDERLAVLDELNSLDVPIYYKPRYSTDNIGSFTKIQTVGNKGGSKYQISTMSGKGDFQIGAKLDTRSFSVPALTEAIREFNKLFEFDGSVYKIKGKAMAWEKRYLNYKPATRPVVKTVAQQIRGEYSEYFDRGILTESVLNSITTADPSLNKEAVLKKLAEEYNKTRGNYGFVYNENLYLTKLDASDLLVINPPVSVTSSNSFKITVAKADGTTQEREVWFGTDESGFINEVQCRCTNFKLVDINAVDDVLDLSDSEFTTIKKAFDEVHSGVRFGVPAMFKNSTTSQELLEKIIAEKNTNAENLINILTRINDRFGSDPKYNEAKNILNKMLNYANSVATFNLNVDDVVILADGTKLQIQSITGNDIVGLEVDSSGNVTSVQRQLSDTDKQNMKKEEPECAPVTLNFV